MTREGDPIEPDTKDWTWVLSRPCSECGFDASAVHHTEVGEVIRRDADEWIRRLEAPRATVRTRPGVWSALEYGCHVRDVHRIFNERVTQMLTQYEPLFANWDQDRTALEDDYAGQNPAVVAGELFDAAVTVADTYASVPEDGWSRRGLRSNGSEFTVASIAVYHVHDVVHHAWDVDEL
ncbi:methyltransferase type 12 [Mycobacterium sp. IS-1742]|uniref:DinB family protein n=1 Tax=Mycobacterium sp. IS-1742 TaxID=1772285 RepID=UPI0007404017|nr:DinB family protein [Mycobacterium sp. IS-1742]KUI31316.1 methyltransferase type 12 [Mycobacterium sp. IS-1742]